MSLANAFSWQEARQGLVLAGAAVFVALVAGVASATANPYVVALTAGLFGGVFLLAYPRLTIWLVLVGGLVVAGLCQLFVPALQKIAWVVTILGFVLMGSVVLSLLSPNSVHRRVPPFIWIACAIIAFALVSSIVQGGRSLETIAGVRRYFPMWGLIFALTVLSLPNDVLERWKKVVLAVALVQLPFALYQLLVLVPKRVGMGPGIVPIDIVAGTFGANMEGGGANNVMATFIAIVVAFLGTYWQEKQIDTRKWLGLSIICVAPLFLGEAKIALVYMIVVFLMLSARDFSYNPSRAFGILFCGGLVVAAIASVLLLFFSKGLTPLEFIGNILAHNFGEEGRAHYELNRWTVLVFWWQQHGLHNADKMLFGHGLGSSFPAVFGLMSGHVHLRYPTMGIGITAASQLLWDLGIVGVALYAALFLSAWQAASSVIRRSDSANLCAGMQAARVALVILALWYPYKATILSNPGAQVIFAFVFGYIGYCWQRVRLESEGRPAPASGRR